MDDYAAVKDSGVTGQFSEASAPLLLEINAGGHYGVTYTSGDVATILQWFQEELGGRG